tara:strand:+ start:649 stop:1206 length:558 start_codon:yes stop_codon:yes gene_type:complete
MDIISKENVLVLDVSQQDQLKAVRDQLYKSNIILDCLINNAGLMTDRVGIEKVSQDDMVQAFRVNSAGPVMLVHNLLPILDSGCKIVNISSLMGSINDNTSGGYYSYRMSKAALNMAVRSMSMDLKKKKIAVYALHPGWVRTRMGSAIAPVSKKRSVNGMIDVIDRLSISDTGKFYNFKGEELPW